MNQPGPLVVQSDHTLMLEVEHPQYADCRDFLVLFAELVKSPEFIHTYRVTPLSLWNAAALGISLAEIEAGLRQYARYGLPANVMVDIREWYSAYGKLILRPAPPDHLRLQATDTVILERIRHDKSLKPFWVDERGDSLFVEAGERGRVKQALIKVGYPVKDLCGYLPGAPLEIRLRPVDGAGNPFRLRDYQADAADAFYQAGRASGGSGIIVLPCGSGKTIIGLGVMARVSNHTLIITTNNVSAYQWRHELLDKTAVGEEDIGEYTGLRKEIRPITLTTYQMLTYRRSKEEPFENL
ncbi:MAG TPA: DEAD/DEAH box helicase family protein, partial [Caldilineae bacterium]|nr:DEAD/DEAH box helicase family protein [Caldilineae bacterium]